MQVLDAVGLERLLEMKQGIAKEDDVALGVRLGPGVRLILAAFRKRAPAKPGLVRRAERGEPMRVQVLLDEPSSRRLGATSLM